MKTANVKIGLLLIAVILSASFAFGQNLVLNPGFEDGTGTLPANWDTATQEGTANFSWVNDEFSTGAKSIRITHTDSAMSSLYQTITVEPSSEYRVTAFIKTQGVECGANWWEGGAQIRVAGDVTGEWYENMTDHICGDTSWTYVELTVTTTESASSIEVHCKLGEGLKIKGTAWFDDVSVTGKLKWFANGDFEIEDPGKPGWPEGWFIDYNWNGATVTWDNTVNHTESGTYSVKITEDVGTEFDVCIRQDRGPEPWGLTDGAYYKVSGWIKTENLEGSDRGACLVTAYNNVVIGGVELKGDNDWTYVEDIIQYQETSWGFLRCLVYLTSPTNTEPGVAWFDDIDVEFLGLPPKAPESATADYVGSEVTLNWTASEIGSSDLDYYLIRKITQNDTTGNIKQNPGFETPNTNGDFAENWSSYGGDVSPTWDYTNPANSGTFSVSMENADDGDWGMIYKKVYPPEGEKGCDALIRGFIKTENVSGGRGATIGFGYSGGIYAEGLFGTNDYTAREAVASIDGGQYATCLFGAYGEQVTGKAWWDDVTVTPFDSVGKSTELTFNDPDVVLDTIYYYSVRAVDVAGYYSPSKIVKVDLNAPDAVVLLQPGDNERTLGTLSWEKVMGSTGYFVDVKKSGTTVWSEEVTETSVTIPEDVLENDVTYTWTVQYIKSGVKYSESDARSFVYTVWPGTFDYVSDLEEVLWENGWGDGNKDLSTDGNPITIGGVVFSKGLGLHAPSKVIYDLSETDYTTFMSYIGIDDEVSGGSGVVFHVVLDGNDTVFTSKTMLPEYPAELIKVDIAGADSLILITDDCGDANSDHSDWANAILYGTTGEGIEGQEVLLPSETNLVGNFPNPFNPTTTIVFELHKPADVTVNIYNMLGQKVANLVKGEYKAGRYEINWDAGLHFSSGIYFYELRAGDYMTVKKMLLLK